MKKGDEKLCEQANEIARAETLKHCHAVKLTPRRVLEKISEGLDATENKVFYDKDRGECVLSPDLVDWGARQKAIDLAVSILGIRPPEKLDVNVSGKIGEKLSEARERAKKVCRKKN